MSNGATTGIINMFIVYRKDITTKWIMMIIVGLFNTVGVLQHEVGNTSESEG